MSTNPLPTLPHTTARRGQANVDRPSWTAGQSFTAYGLRFGLRSNNPAALELAAPHLPLGWVPAPPGDTDDAVEVDILYSLRLAHSTPSAGQAPPSQRQGQRHYHLLYYGSALLACTLELPQLFDTLARHAELLTAFLASDCLFVHAGAVAVGWQRQAILIPGRSFAGKTTLVKALVEAGAVYYSDEFAVLDK